MNLIISSQVIFFYHLVAPDLCSAYNGGCHQNAACNQTGQSVNCTCYTDYKGDGYSCEPINRLGRSFPLSLICCTLVALT